MSRRVLATLAAVTLLLGVAACGDEGEGPVTTPPPPVDNGPSDSGGASQEPSDGGGDEEETDEPTVAAPDVPAPDPADYPGMDEETPEGAEQALRYYIAVVYWGYQTGETETLGTLHTKNCEQCRGIATEIQNVGATGSHWDSAPIQQVGSDSEPGDDTDLQASYGYKVGAHKERRTDSQAPENVNEIAYTVLAGMNWGDNGWAIDWMLLAESYHAE